MDLIQQLDDPWCWDLERLVCELCTEKRSWVPLSPKLPDPVKLEAILREHGVNGAIFLTYVNERHIHHEWNFYLAAEKFNLLGCIEQLRLRSPKWLAWNKQVSAVRESHHQPERLYSTGLGSHQTYEEEIPLQSRVSKPSPGLKRSAFAQPENDTTSLPTSPSDYGHETQQNTTQQAEPVPTQAHINSPDESRKGESWVVDSTGRKRRRLDVSAITTLPLPAKKTDMNMRLAEDDPASTPHEAVEITSLNKAPELSVQDSALDDPETIQTSSDVAAVGKEGEHQSVISQASSVVIVDDEYSHEVDTPTTPSLLPDAIQEVMLSDQDNCSKDFESTGIMAEGYDAVLPTPNDGTSLQGIPTTADETDRSIQAAELPQTNETDFRTSSDSDKTPEISDTVISIESNDFVTTAVDDGLQHEQDPAVQVPAGQILTHSAETLQDDAPSFALVTVHSTDCTIPEQVNSNLEGMEIAALHSSTPLVENYKAHLNQQEDNNPSDIESPDSAAFETADESSPRKLREPAASHITLEPNTYSPKEKRKRIAPTLISNVPSQISPATNSSQNEEQSSNIPLSVLQENAGHQPLSINSQTRNDGILSPEVVSQNPRQRRDMRLVALMSDGYLGKRKMPIDQLFYGDAKIGQTLTEIDLDEPLTQLLPHDISTGRRLYVHKAMKRYLRTPTHHVQRGSEKIVVLQPYPAKLLPPLDVPCVTVYRTRPDGSTDAIKEAASKWPEINKAFSSEGVQGLDLSALVDREGLDFDEARYEKYFNLANDEILPAFDPSLEENDMSDDEEVSREIDQELAKLNSGSREAVQRTRHELSRDEVESIIAERIAVFKTHWREKDLPKLQRGAYKSWKGSRDKLVKTRLLEKWQESRDLLHNQRLPKLQEELLKETWTSKKDIIRVSGVLERSIRDLESFIWRIKLIECDEQPEKLDYSNERKSRAAVTTNTSLQTNTGENKGSGSETVSGSEDEDEDSSSLDNFISHDEGLAEDVDMVDADQSDIQIPTDTDSEPIVAIPKRRSIKLLLKQPGSRRNHSPFQDTHESNAERDSLIVKLPIRVTTTAAEQGLAKDLSSDLDSDDDITRPRRRTRMCSPESEEEEFDTEDLWGTKHDEPIKPTNFRKSNNRDDDDSSSDFEDPVSQSNSQLKLPDTSSLPRFDNPDAVARFPYATWQHLQDRRRLMIAAVHKLPDDKRLVMLEWLTKGKSSPKMWSFFKERYQQAIASTSDRYVQLDEHMLETSRLFTIWVDCKFQHPRRRLSLSDAKAQLRKFEDVQPQFKPFWITLNQLRRTYEHNHEVNMGSGSASHSREGSTEPNGIVNSQTRKKTVWIDRNARQNRESEKKRQEAYQKRKRELEKRLAQEGTSMNADHAHIMINVGKSSEQDGFIYVPENIGQRILPHQIEGVRFMWSQVVSTDRRTEQGCLLAHTMGLGKTMQVITLLSAIAQAASSGDESISSQIPENLRTSRTLILAPVSLLDNWLDELLTWAPDKLLGDFRKLESQIDVQQRCATVAAWHENGGVLLIGYEMFRGILENKATANRDPPYSETQQEKLKTWLLEGPNIIVADEAHKMKNTNAMITKFASEFRSKSRIALTGSPLANNVEEYHAMINWTCPGYLGPIKEFRVRFAEPIHEGLWVQSNYAQRRKALKMLKVLDKDISPKVHRRDISHVAKEMPPKAEFVLIVPLTASQEKAYRYYTDSASGTVRATSEIQQLNQATVWSWLGPLTLLCHHPAALKARLQERKRDAARKSAHQNPGEDNENTEDISRVLASQPAEQFLVDAFGETDLQDPNLSNKVQLLNLILEASKTAKDKVLIFSQSLVLLDFLEAQFELSGRKFFRLDGSTKAGDRQRLTKRFNSRDMEVFLISTTAGGLGLNIQGANRVVIFDFKYNPVWEEQAVGRAYRLGQTKPVFVYKFIMGGTFEELMHNRAVFKLQLASRVVDKKNIQASASRELSEYLAAPREVPQEDLSMFKGKDPMVLDKILNMSHSLVPIRKIVETDTFQRIDNTELTAEEQREVQEIIDEEKMRRVDPEKYAQMQRHREAMRYNALAAQHQAASATFQSSTWHSAPRPFDVLAARQPHQLQVNVSDSVQSIMSQVPSFASSAYASPYPPYAQYASNGLAFPEASHKVCSAGPSSLPQPPLVPSNWYPVVDRELPLSIALTPTEHEDGTHQVVDEGQIRIQTFSTATTARIDVSDSPNPPAITIATAVQGSESLTVVPSQPDAVEVSDDTESEPSDTEMAPMPISREHTPLQDNTTQPDTLRKVLSVEPPNRFEISTDNESDAETVVLSRSRNTTPALEIGVQPIISSLLPSQPSKSSDGKPTSPPPSGHQITNPANTCYATASQPAVENTVNNASLLEDSDLSDVSNSSTSDFELLSVQSRKKSAFISASQPARSSVSASKKHVAPEATSASLMDSTSLNTLVARLTHRATAAPSSPLTVGSNAVARNCPERAQSSTPTRRVSTMTNPLLSPHFAEKVPSSSAPIAGSSRVPFVPSKRAASTQWSDQKRPKFMAAPALSEDEIDVPKRADNRSTPTKSPTKTPNKTSKPSTADDSDSDDLIITRWVKLNKPNTPVSSVKNEPSSQSRRRHAR